MAQTLGWSRTLGRFLLATAVPLWWVAGLEASSLSVDTASRYAGTYGLQVLVEASSSAWVEDATPNGEARYRLRFYVRLNGLVQSPGSELDLFQAFAAGAQAEVRLLIGTSTTLGRYLRVAARRDDGTFAETPAGGEMPLANGWRAIEIDWKRASAGGANDGALAVWVDGQAYSGLTGLDNDQQEISTVRWGAVAGLTGAGGSFRLDEFESRRTERIGLLSIFSDVPSSSSYWRWVQAVYNAEVTTGCGGGLYCPGSAVPRDQMSVFLLHGKEGGDYRPAACLSPPFGDVPVTSPYCPWIQELASRGVTSGCGGGNYCPAAAVTRAQMAVFLLLTLEGGGYLPDPCTAAPFADVPASSPYCPWIQALVTRGVAGGCGGGNYCPGTAASRAQMAVFVSRTFALPVPVP